VTSQKRAASSLYIRRSSVIFIVSRLEAMKLGALILLLLMSAAGCSRQSESAASSDQKMQHKLAGVWVHNRTLKSGPDIVAFLEMNQDGTYTGIDTFSKPMPDGVSRVETGGRWRIENGFLIMTGTSSSLTNAHLPEEARIKIVRLDERELEYEPPDKYEGFSVSTNHIIYKKQTR
jgi:hypothetical protein